MKPVNRGDRAESVSVRSEKQISAIFRGSSAMFVPSEQQSSAQHRRSCLIMRETSSGCGKNHSPTCGSKKMKRIASPNHTREEISVPFLQNNPHELSEPVRIPKPTKHPVEPAFVIVGDQMADLSADKVLTSSPVKTQIARYCIGMQCIRPSCTKP